MARFQRNCGFYPGDADFPNEPTGTWGQLPRGTIQRSSLNIPTGVFKATPEIGDIEHVPQGPNQYPFIYIVVEDGNYPGSRIRVPLNIAFVLYRWGKGSLLTWQEGAFYTGVNAVQAPTFSGYYLVSKPTDEQGIGWIPQEACRVLFLLAGEFPIIWHNMPAAETELLGNIYHRRLIESQCFMSARLLVHVITPGATNAELRVQWNAGSLGWKYFDFEENNGFGVKIDATGWAVSDWQLISENARGINVELRIVGIGGNETTSPSFACIALELSASEK